MEYKKEWPAIPAAHPCTNPKDATRSRCDRVFADKIHQLSWLADFLRDEPAELQTAFVDEIVPHT